MRKNHNRAVHKAAFVVDKLLDLTYYTVCGKTSSNHHLLKTHDWDRVTCKKCLTSKLVFSKIDL
jgi:hypothetical protein